MLNLSKLKKSFGYAFEGLIYSFNHNQNIKIQVLVAIVVIAVGFLFKLSGFEFFSIGMLIVLVISAEMINTAIEEVINLLVNEHRLEAKIAKDVSAGMVFFISIVAAIMSFIIFIPHILNLISR